MNLLLIRHAIAMEREDFAPSGKPDSERPLTAEGREKMVRNAGGLARQVDAIELLASSPYVRARDTAEIVAAAYPKARRAETTTLEPMEPPETFAKWLGVHMKGMPEGGTIAAVGHEPHLGELATWLLKAQGTIAFKKGGACLITLDEAPRRGSGELRWLLTPGQLRKLA